MLEEIDIQGQGFQPLKDHGSWRIAQLSFDPRVNALDSLASLGRHFETEEAFILLQGEAVMVTAGTQDRPGSYEAIKFVGGRIYVVRQRQWHTAVLKPGTQLLIVENRDTGVDNSENHSLSAEEKFEVKVCVARAESG